MMIHSDLTAEDYLDAAENGNAMIRTPCTTFLRPTPPHARVNPTAELSVNDGLRAAMLAQTVLSLVNVYPAEVAVAALELAIERTEAR